MNWKWTDHIKLQLKERKISKELAENTLDNPDNIINGKEGRKIYQKITGDKLIRVVTEKESLITAYLTDKINKYMEG